MTSPLRRSTKSARLQGPILSQLAINDDEAERQASREQTINFEISTASTVSDREGLADCLKIVNANKLTKDNVWSLSLIDNFSRLVNRHHKSVQSFQVAGSTLEASSRIYGVRVDSVHNDVMHMATGLIGMEGLIAIATGSGRASTNGQGDVVTTTPLSSKRSRKKTQISTITRNKETINAKLDTNTQIEPTFAKLNSVVGDINSSHRLLTYVLPTISSELIHFSKHRFWDSTEHPIVMLDESVDFANMPCGAANNIISLSADLTLRHHAAIQSYRITDTPAVDGEEAREPSPMDQSSDEFDAENFDVAFDMNADVEAVPDRSEHPISDDLRPLDSTSKTLEYSYRPKDKIDQYWAGPSYWKIRKTQQSTDRSQRKTTGRRKQQQPIDVTVEYDKSIFISMKSRLAKKLNKRNTQKNWNAKRLKLPVNYNRAPDYFEHYQFAAGLVKWCPNVEIDTAVVRPSDELQTVQTNDNDDDDDEADRYEDGIGQTHMDQTNNATLTEIADEFKNAPEKVALIDIPFAKRNKVIDMKQLKRCCWSTIAKQCFDYKRNKRMPSDASQMYREHVHSDSEVTTFKKVCTATPHLLSKAMQEVISPAVTFLSILHLASEQHLRLVSDDDRSDFLIIKDDKAKLPPKRK